MILWRHSYDNMQGDIIGGRRLGHQKNFFERLQARNVVVINRLIHDAPLQKL